MQSNEWDRKLDINLLDMKPEEDFFGKLPCGPTIFGGYNMSEGVQHHQHGTE